MDITHKCSGLGGMLQSVWTPALPEVAGGCALLTDWSVAWQRTDLICPVCQLPLPVARAVPLSPARPCVVVPVQASGRAAGSAGAWPRVPPGGLFQARQTDWLGREDHRSTALPSLKRISTNTQGAEPVLQASNTHTHTQ